MKKIILPVLTVLFMVLSSAHAAEDPLKLVDMASDIVHTSEPERQYASRQVLAYGPKILPLLKSTYKAADFGRKQVLLRLIAGVGGVEEEAFILNELKNGDFFVSNAATRSLPYIYERFKPEILAGRILFEKEKKILLAQLYGAFMQARTAGNLAPPLEQAVVRAMQNTGEATVKTACATVLRYAKSQNAVTALLAAASDTGANSRLLIEVCTALRHIHPSGESKVIEKLASCGRPDVEVNALAVLAGMGYDGVDDALLVLRSDKSIAVRIKAYEYLGEYGGVKNLHHIAKGLKDPDPAVRYVVVNTLGSLASPQTSALLRPLMGEGGDKNPEVRAAAAIAFHRGNRIGASGVLIREAANTHEKYKRYRIEAIRALGEIKARQGLRVLYEALESTDATVSAAAARAIGRIGDKSAVSVLQNRLKTAKGNTRVECLTAIATLKGEN